MRVLLYSIQSALKNLWVEKWINLLTTLSVAVGLLILSAFITVTLNMDSVLKRWSRSFGIVVFLDDNISADTTDTVRELFKKDSDVLKVNYISEDEALKELREILGANATILDDLEQNPLPSSFELNLKRDLLKPAYVKKKAGEIEKMSGVSEVQYGEKWLSSLNTVSGIMKASSIFLGGAILIAITFITYNTIKIFFYRRKEEIETLKLLGATKSFIRLPFLLEGLVLGIIGGVIGSFALYGIHSLIVSKGLYFMPSVRAIIISIPAEIFLSVPVAGALMSFIGSFIAVGKIRY